MNARVLAGAAALAFSLAAPAAAQDAHAGHGQAPPDEPALETPMTGRAHDAPMEHGDMHEEAAPRSEPPQHGQHANMDTLPVGHDMSSMAGIFGAYPMGRDASGTSWQPDVSTHGGVDAQRGAWMLMGHALFNAVHDWQNGPRGDEKSFLAGMVMGSARRDFANGDTLNFRAMLSPDPLMGKDGYPLLFAAGESADGQEPLVDRQHPHDLVMELSASYAHKLGEADSVFVYAGLPGEPAFGPPAFMHRLSAMDSPEAPLSHHWLDSTHITFGVITAGWAHGAWKLEASRFRGREPDEHRYDIESGALDSTALRASWNPTSNLALQISYADLSSPEALEPDEDEKRASASALYTRALGDGWWSATLAFGHKERSNGVSLDAWLAEAALHPNEAWTLFARAETIETDELGALHHGPIERVARFSAGAIHDWRVAEHVMFGIGALAQSHRAPDALEAGYGGDPAGAMAFARLKIG